MEEEKASGQSREMIHLPPGFRFHPTDEELILHYLVKKTTNTPLPATIFADVELYKFNPWDLPMKASFGDEEWYFFSPRDRKYPNGMRPNRMASSGYWKATGTDKPILTSCGSKVVGVKKALVFYVGRPPKGNKTDWIMHEYRLPESTWNHNKEKTMRLDDWVLCRVKHKAGMPGQFLEKDRKGLRQEYSAYKKPEGPFLLGFQNPCMEMDAAVSTISFHCTDAATTAVSDISFEGKKTTSSVCEDNFFNVDYNLQNLPVDMMRKRKATYGNSEDLSSRNINKKPAAQYSGNNDTTVTGDVSTLDQLGSVNMLMMMYPDVYNWDLMPPKWSQEESTSLTHRFS